MDEVVPAAEIVAMIGAEMPFESVALNYPGEVVERWRYGDGSGEIGVIASVTRPFCGGCTRVRLSADGKLFTCLLPVAGHDLRALLCGGAPVAEISAAIGGIWWMREDRYSGLRTAATAGLPQGRDVLHRRVGHSAVALAAATSSRPRSRGSCRSDGRSRPPRS
jgi:cyclic pyranopterin phosphate synthase